MNDPTKRIDVEKSSLLSLKAELLRKQEEVLKNKKSVPAFVKQTKKIKSKDETRAVHGGKITEVEDSRMISKSRKILEAKAKYYDRMVKSKGTISDENSLVMFNKKKPQPDPECNDEELIDYTDCFGRSRKIPKKDLHKIKEQDEELTNVAESRDQQVEHTEDDSRSSKSAGEISEAENESVFGPEIGLQFMKQREEWQKQEEINKERTSIHYRDILFDEAREHGVGFYEFSTDHDERSKQQEALSKIRDSTLEAQQQRANLKQSRDSIIANRVKQAKIRLRARLGLPPEEEAVEDNNLYDESDEKKEKEEKLAKKKAEIEKKKERERKKYVRPWDKDKTNRHESSSSESESETETEWKPQREYRPMSQDEWNEKQRAERKTEFAPMTSTFVRGEEIYDPNKYLEEEKNEKSLFFSSAKTFKRRNKSPEITPVGAGGATIPPPATFEYFGPSNSKQSKSIPSANLEASISAGLKYLREQVDKGNKHKWSAANDYTNNA